MWKSSCERNQLFLFLFFCAFLLLFFYFSRPLWPTFVISFFLFYLLAPAVDFLEKKGVERTLSALSIFILLGSALFISSSLLSNFVLDQFRSFQQQWPTYQKKSIGWLKDSKQQLEKRFNLSLDNLFQKAEKQVKDFSSQAARESYKTLTKTLSLLTFFLLIPLFTFFLLKDSASIKKAFFCFVPNRYFELFHALFSDMGEKVGRYLRGQLLAAAIVGFLFFLGMLLIRVPYALVLGTVVALFNIIPYIGPIAGAIPAIVVAEVFAPSFSLLPALKVVAVALAVRGLDDAFIGPLVVGKSVHLHPLTVILSLFIGGELLGILGMVVAVPTAAILKVIATTVAHRVGL